MVGLRSGLVRLAGFQSVLSAVVPHAAATLRRAHPGIELRLVDAHPEVALGMLRDGQVDAAFVFRYDDEPPDGVRASHLFDDPMHLLSLDGARRLRDHRDSPWIAGCPRCRREFLDACQRAGFTPRIAFTSDDVIVEQALVAAGMGVTTIPGLALRSHRAPGIQAAALPDFRRRVYLATYGDPPDPPATAAFVAALHHAVERTAPGEPPPR
jgi:DNA-binding transcriptional LysR family regulator